MVMNTFTVLCSHQFCLVPKCFVTTKRTPISIKQSLPTAPPSSPWLLPVCILFQWIYLFCVFYIVEWHNMWSFVSGCFHFACFWGSSSCSLNQYLISFYGWVITHYMYMPQFVYPFIHWYLGCFHLLAFTNVHLFCLFCFQFFWWYT